MTLLYRTWPYGTRKSAEVVDRIQHGSCAGLIVRDGDGEMYVLLHRSDVVGEQGDRGYIEFRKGGPTGGYWMFVSQPSGVSGVSGASGASGGAATAGGQGV